MMASLNWRMLERQEMERAFSRACAKTGKRIAARIAIMAITTSSSIRVKPILPLSCLRTVHAYIVVFSFEGLGTQLGVRTALIFQARCGNRVRRQGVISRLRQV